MRRSATLFGLATAILVLGALSASNGQGAAYAQDDQPHVALFESWMRDV
jgi:hypothetical protein